MVPTFLNQAPVSMTVNAKATGFVLPDNAFLHEFPVRLGRDTDSPVADASYDRKNKGPRDNASSEAQPWLSALGRSGCWAARIGHTELLILVMLPS